MAREILVKVDSATFLRAMYAVGARIETFEQHVKECTVADPAYWNPIIADLRADYVAMDKAYDNAETVQS